MHSYADFDLYRSDVNYDLKNRNQYDYRITYIRLKTPEFETSRGVGVGSAVEDVYKAYGHGEESSNDGITTIIYSLNDMRMRFTIDENQKVTGISLSIVVSE